MAHRQRQEECLLLSVVSRSVGQRRSMRVSFAPAFCFLPKHPLASQVFFFCMGGVMGITSDFSTSVDRSAELLHSFGSHAADSLFEQPRVFCPPRPGIYLSYNITDEQING